MKKFLLMMILLLMNCATCSAEEVQAFGRGINERMAIHDAMRSAIEQKFGAKINSKSRVRNSMLILDENSVDSSGFVTRWEILSSRVENGIFIVEIRAELDDEKISARLSELDMKSLVDFNFDNPRVAVAAFDSNGRRYPEIENEIITALKNRGFTRTIDLSQVNRAVNQRIFSAAGDIELCKTLANDFHADYLVISQVKIVSSDEISISSRIIELNTGEIIFAGTSTGGGGFISAQDALKMSGRRAGYEISTAAFKSAAKIERHVTLLITKPTFERLGGSLTAVSARIRNISGVNDVFARKMTSSLEFDVDFDGTAADFAQILESYSIKILELGSSYVKI